MSNIEYIYSINIRRELSRVNKKKLKLVKVFKSSEMTRSRLYSTSQDEKSTFFFGGKFMPLDKISKGLVLIIKMKNSQSG